VDGGDFTVIGDVTLISVLPGADVEDQNFVNTQRASIAGMVFNDENRLTDGTVNGVGTDAGGLFIALVNPANDQVIATVAVAPDGSYLFDHTHGVQINSSYLLILTTVTPAVGDVLTAATLPHPWISTGEHLGAGPGSDGTVDGKLAATTTVGALTEANFGIIRVPDVTPVITAIPNVMNGPTPFNIIVRVTELNVVDTDGLITVRIPKDFRWVRSGPYNPALVNLSGFPLNNADWTYSENATQHIFKSSVVIPAGGFSYFGFSAAWNAGQTQGIYTITSQIDSWSGGEDRIDNNSDAEKLDYFIK